MKTITTRCPNCREWSEAEFFARGPRGLEQVDVAFMGPVGLILCWVDPIHLRCRACGFERRPKLYERSVFYGLSVILILLVAITSICFFLSRVILGP